MGLRTAYDARMICEEGGLPRSRYTPRWSGKRNRSHRYSFVFKVAGGPTSSRKALTQGRRAKRSPIVFHRVLYQIQLQCDMRSISGRMTLARAALLRGKRETSPLSRPDRPKCLYLAEREENELRNGDGSFPPPCFTLLHCLTRLESDHLRALEFGPTHVYNSP